MKNAIFAYTVFFALTAAVFINSFFVSKCISEISDKLEDIPSSTDYSEDYSEVYDDFISARKYLNLTVPHSDIAEIESDFCEILGAIEVQDEESLTIAKSRLLGSLSHLKRISGINADSIF